MLCIDKYKKGRYVVVVRLFFTHSIILLQGFLIALDNEKICLPFHLPKKTVTRARIVEQSRVLVVVRWLLGAGCCCGAVACCLLFHFPVDVRITPIL